MVEVTLLTQENCAFCEQAKEVLGRLSVEYPITVRELDMITPEGQELAWHGGVMFPPGIFVGRDPFSYGRPSEKRLRRELERRLAQGGARP